MVYCNLLAGLAAMQYLLIGSEKEGVGQLLDFGNPAGTLAM